MAPPAEPATRGDDDARPPPPFRSWKALYALVLGALATTIVALYAVTRLYAR